MAAFKIFLKLNEALSKSAFSDIFRKKPINFNLQLNEKTVITKHLLREYVTFLHYNFFETNIFVLQKLWYQALEDQYGIYYLTDIY